MDEAVIVNNAVKMLVKRNLGVRSQPEWVPESLLFCHWINTLTKQHDSCTYYVMQVLTVADCSLTVNHYHSLHYMQPLH